MSSDGGPSAMSQASTLELNRERSKSPARMTDRGADVSVKMGGGTPGTPVSAHASYAAMMLAARRTAGADMAGNDLGDLGGKEVRIENKSGDGSGIQDAGTNCGVGIGGEDTEDDDEDAEDEEGVDGAEAELGFDNGADERGSFGEGSRWSGDDSRRDDDQEDGEDEDGDDSNDMDCVMMAAPGGDGYLHSIGRNGMLSGGSSSAAMVPSQSPVSAPPIAVIDPRGGPYQCPYCVKKFSLKGNREKHVRAIHLLIRAFVCPICKHSSSYKRNLDRHILNVHHRLKPFHCPDCMRSFSQKTNIRTHLKLVHGVEMPFPRPHACRQCHIMFDTKARLRSHSLAEHHGKVAWACSLCKRQYRWRRSLRKRKRASVLSELCIKLLMRSNFFHFLSLTPDMAQKHQIENPSPATIPGITLENADIPEYVSKRTGSNPPKRDAVAAGEASNMAAAIAATSETFQAAALPAAGGNRADVDSLLASSSGRALRGRPPASVTAERAAEAAALVVACAGLGDARPAGPFRHAGEDVEREGEREAERDRRPVVMAAAAARAVVEASVSAAAGVAMPAYGAVVTSVGSSDARRDAGANGCT